MNGVRSALRRCFELAESRLDRVFGGTANPAHQLGALGWFFFWIVIVTGIYLYVFFDSGVTRAYESVEALTVSQWYAGGIMRSLHRYASDAMVIVVMLHLVRDFAYDRFSGPRWFTWITGVPLLWFLFAAGISGYWVVWDRLAQYVAISTTEWLDALPLFAEPIARNFLHSGTLGERFFTLLVFIHIAVPLFMLFMMWIHIQRLSQPRVNPPRSLALGLLAALFVLALLAPAHSQGPADLDTVPPTLNLDWFFLAMFPLLDHLSGAALWLITMGATFLLLVTPWLLRDGPAGTAVVNLDNCNGCSRCFMDCPYGAITMAPRSDGKSYAVEAVVSADRCVACGICVGACPTATPFRRRTELLPGIDLEHLPLRDVQGDLMKNTASLDGRDSLVVLGCEHGPALQGLPRDGVAALGVPCLGMVPPAFVDFILSRGLAQGVLLAGCREGNCYYRLGDRWTRDRIARRRDPWLRSRVPAARVRICFAGGTGRAVLDREIADFREHLTELGKTDNGAPV